MELVIITWRGRLARLGGAYGALIMPFAAMGTRYGYWDFRFGFELLGLALGFALLAVLLFLLYGFREKFAGDKTLLRSGLGFALIPLGVSAFVILSSIGKPLTHNISTDLQDPPTFHTLLSIRSKDSNPVNIDAATAQLQRQAYPHIQTIRTSLTATDSVSRAILISHDLNWDLIDTHSRAGYIEASHQSFWFGFVDDIVVRVRPTADGSIIDLHSVSRVGKGDLGANAARIEAFIEAFGGR
jgi:uncharacterized protein (DUF1499 family)